MKYLLGSANFQVNQSLQACEVFTDLLTAPYKHFSCIFNSDFYCFTLLALILPALLAHQKSSYNDPCSGGGVV